MAYSLSRILAGLEAWWSFDSATGNQAAINNAARILTNNAGVAAGTGKVAGSADFNGSSTYYSVASASWNRGPSSSRLGHWAVGFWFKLDTVSGSKYLVSVEGSSAATKQWLAYMFNNRLDFHWHTGSAYSTVISKTGLTTGTWYFVVFRLQVTSAPQTVGRMSFYDAGVLTTGSRTEANQPTDGVTQIFGVGYPGFGAGSSVLDGMMDELFLYYHATEELTDDDIAWLYNSGNGRAYANLFPKTGLNAWWKQDLSNV